MARFYLRRAMADRNERMRLWLILQKRIIHRSSMANPNFPNRIESYRIGLRSSSPSCIMHYAWPMKCFFLLVICFSFYTLSTAQWYKKVNGQFDIFWLNHRIRIMIGISMNCDRMLPTSFYPRKNQTNTALQYMATNFSHRGLANRITCVECQQVKVPSTAIFILSLWVSFVRIIKP